MINKTRKEIKGILKRIKIGKTIILNIEDCFNAFRITKINDDKYKVACVCDPFFFGMYKEVDIDKNNLITMIEKEKEKRL